MKKTELKNLVVLDFEATCDEDNPPLPQEIIEFPSVLLDGETLEVIDEFESFVRPIHHPTLTTFCTELTSIEQKDVDDAPTFPNVLARHLEWLRSHGLPTEGTAIPKDTAVPYAFVTCGDWDLNTMLPTQLRACAMDYVPAPYRQWINIKVPFKKWKRKPAGMARMLQALDLELEGRHHRGIDDCRNIAKIVRALVARHQRMQITTELAPSRYPPITLLLEREGRKKEVLLGRRARGTLLGAASGAFRRQANRAFVGRHELLDDRDLLDLRSGALVRIA